LFLANDVFPGFTHNPYLQQHHTGRGQVVLGEHFFPLPVVSDQNAFVFF
jgi:hypothetical protein